MKKVIFIACFAFISIISFSQQSIVVQKTDSVTLEDIAYIKNNMNYFYKENRQSQIVTLIGSAIFASSYFFDFKNEDLSRAFKIYGATTMAFGVALYIDSFRFIDFRNNKFEKF